MIMIVFPWWIKGGSLARGSGPGIDDHAWCAPVWQGAALTQTLFSQADSHAARTWKNVQSITKFQAEPAKRRHRREDGGIEPFGL
ncbi:hypothetical protein FE772_08385 [Lysobacter enzymogenes]|nr:hypothetical protein FE772_08385 [Lysobacter enzymogenes]